MDVGLWQSDGFGGMEKLEAFDDGKYVSIPGFFREPGICRCLSTCQAGDPVPDSVQCASAESKFIGIQLTSVERR